MPFVNVKLVDGVFTEDEKHRMAAALTDVMVKFEGSEAFREVVWVLIEELHTDGWHIGGLPFRGPASLMDGLARSKSLYESIEPSDKLEHSMKTVLIVGHPDLRSSRINAAVGIRLAQVAGSDPGSWAVIWR